ncbi:MAG: lipase family protein [Terracidiphilus sp.]|nr:lipase family protein [Terracidiphilus sp.]
MNLPAALQAGSLLQFAYSVFKNHQPNYDGMAHDGFNVIQTIYANDLATDLSPNIDPIKDVVSIGFVARSAAAAGEYVIVIRGTEGILEWLQDLKFLPEPFATVPGSGLTEDGFTDMYNSFRVAPDPNSARLTPSLGGLLGDTVSKLTICGHSLGSALATLLALDVVVNTPYKQPSLITFASPRVGDLHFSSFFNSVVPDCVRIANRMDIVTHVPLPPLYIHVGDENELNPGGTVENNVLCEHAMDTYMFLLAPGANQLDPQCVPKP